VIAGALVVALVVVDGMLYPSWRNQPGKAERREQLLASVNSSVAKVLSYDYRHIDQDATAAAANLTGKFKDDYTKSMATTVKHDAPGVKAIVTGEVGSSGISSVSADGNQAVVLVLGQQTVSNTALSTPRLDSVSLRVTMTRVGGKWLIAKLDQL
jgi:Mce-associated membrane protein